MWFSGCLLAAPTTPLFPKYSLFPSPFFICILPFSSFFPAFFIFLACPHALLCKNHSSNKLCDNQNILAFLANECTFLVIQLDHACQKKSWCASVREEGGRGKRHGWEKGMLKNTEIWRKKKKRGELSEESERQEWSVKEWEVEQKMRQREGEREGWSNAFWQRWVQDGFMVTSWLIFEESIDRRAVHLSLDTHVGEPAERSCWHTHRWLCQRPVNAPQNMHRRRKTPVFIFSFSPYPPLFPSVSSAV